MRIVPFLISGICTAGLVWALNTQLPAGGSKTPRLGYFLSPQKGFWHNAEPADADFSASLQVPGLHGKVDVYMDDRLVPHIYASDDLDAYYVQGYLHAKFRLWQMDFQAQVAAGRLSEIVGPERLATDRFFRRLGMVYGAEQTMAAMEHNPVMKATLDAYTQGVNTYIHSLKPEQLPFEYKLLDYQPEDWSPLKTYLFLMFMSYDLTGRGVVNDLQMTNARNYFGQDALDMIYPSLHDSLDPIIPKGTAFEAPSLHPQAPETVGGYLHTGATDSSLAMTPVIPDKDNGSNNWAVSGTKTKSGRPILCNDPHLGLNLPSLWYECQITTPTHNTYGASFPGSPAVIIGFNDSIAWGVTNAGRDVLDYYQMQFRDSTMSEYLYNGVWTKAEKRTEIIHVKGQPDLVEHIAMTVFGPVMYDHTYSNASTQGKYLAVHWTAHLPGKGLQTFYELDRAKNYQDYLDAISKWTCPGQNFVFASKTGDIAIKQQGAFIARWKHQGDYIMPGTDSSYRWQGIIPSDENPMMKNPVRGFVSSANQMAVDSTYPYYLGTAASFPLYRGITINRELAGMNNIMPEDMEHLQMNNYNAFAATARPVIIKYLDETQLNEAERKYIGLLKNWDLRGDYAEKGATVFKCVWDSLEQQVWGDEMAGSKLPLPAPDAPTLVESLLRDSSFRFVDDIRTKNKKETLREDMLIAVRKASVHLEELEKKGMLEWGKWKDTHVNHLLQLPALSRLHLPIGGGEHMVNAAKDVHGPSWRMVVQLTDKIEAYGVYPGGQSGNPGSRYYDNFVDSWATGKYYRLLFLTKNEAAKDSHIKWHIQFTNN
ncbi:MAG TPA: penicillin acylase family protein [Sediminibacterium sp.]|nr:penicillin acylase family protein [Sediminibacterium sp.]